MTIKIPKELFEEWNQKTVGTISPISIIIYASINRVCPKYVMEEMLEKSGFTKDRQRFKNGHFIGSTKKMAQVLKLKKEIQIKYNQEIDLDYFFLLDLQFGKTLTNSMHWDKEEMKLNSMTVFDEVKFKTVRSKRRNIKFAYFINVHYKMLC